MGIPTVTDALHTEDHPAYARGSDTRHLAGDVVQGPMPRDPIRFENATGASGGADGYLHNPKEVLEGYKDNKRIVPIRPGK